MDTSDEATAHDAMRRKKLTMATLWSLSAAGLTIASMILWLLKILPPDIALFWPLRIGFCLLMPVPAGLFGARIVKKQAEADR